MRGRKVITRMKSHELQWGCGDRSGPRSEMFESDKKTKSEL